MARKLSAEFERSKISALGLGILAALAAGASGCGEGATPPSNGKPDSSDDPSNLPFPSVAFDEPIPDSAPRRIVSVIPSVTETLFVLGLGDRVVARSDWCDFPKEATALPSVGRQESLSLERIADFKPDVVFAWAHLPDAGRVLTEVFKLRVVTPGTETKDEVFEGIGSVAEACGVPRRGAALVRAIRAGLEAVRERRREAPRRRTLVALDRNPLFAPGAASFVDEMLEVAGAINVAATPGGKPWVTFSAEKVLDWNPEVVIDLSMGDPAEAVAARAYWDRFVETDAVRNGRVRTLAAGVMVRPGPRMAAVADLLGKLVHDD